MLCNSLFLRIRQRHKAYSVGQSRKNFCIHIDLPPNTFYNVWYSRTIQQMMWRKMLCEASRSSALLSFRSRTINCILAFQSWNLTGCSRLCMRLTVRSISARPALPRSLILTLIYRYEYRTMESIAKEYEVSLDTIADNIHWVERTLLNADILQTSVTCVYKTN